MTRSAAGTTTRAAAAPQTRTRAASESPGAGVSSRSTRAVTPLSRYLVILVVRHGERAGRGPGGARRPDPDQRGDEFAGRPLPRRVIVREHLDEQRHRRVGPLHQHRPGEGPGQRGEREQHEVVPFPEVGPLVGQDRGQFRLVQQVERAGADHDAGAQPGHAVGGRSGMIDDQGAGDFRVAVREQAQQRPVPPPVPQHRPGRGDQHPAQQGEQRRRGAQAEQPQRREETRRPDLAGHIAGRVVQHRERAARHPGPDRIRAERRQGPDRGYSPAQPHGLPQHDGRRR